MTIFKLKHPIWFSVLFAGAEMILLNLVSIPLLFLLMAAYHVDQNSFSDGTLAFMLSALTEGITAGLVILAACLLHHRGIVYRKGCAWLKGIIPALFPLAMIGLLAAISLSSGWGHALAPAASIVWFCIYMLTIGILEESTFRGVVAEVLLQNFGTERRGIWKAALISSLLFGLVHLQNMLGADAVSTLVQVVFAFCFGLLLVSIYFRTGNLWIPILLHAGWDFAALIGVGIFGIGSMTVTETPSAVSILENLVISGICLIPVPILLRRKKLKEVSDRFAPEIVAARERVEKMEQKRREEMERYVASVRSGAAGAAAMPYHVEPRPQQPLTGGAPAMRMQQPAGMPYYAVPRPPVGMPRYMAPQQGGMAYPPYYAPPAQGYYGQPVYYPPYGAPQPNMPAWPNAAGYPYGGMQPQPFMDYAAYNAAPAPYAPACPPYGYPAQQYVQPAGDMQQPAPVNTAPAAPVPPAAAGNPMPAEMQTAQMQQTAAPAAPAVEQTAAPAAPTAPAVEQTAVPTTVQPDDAAPQQADPAQEEPAQREDDTL